LQGRNIHDFHGCEGGERDQESGKKRRRKAGGRGERRGTIWRKGRREGR
jgi:hypothetical protein